MRIHTTRFGEVQAESEDVLHFPTGLPGLEECRQWVLLADPYQESLVWLQNMERAEVALALTSPRRYLPHYQARVVRSELECLNLERPNQAEILVVVGKNDHAWTLNLKAPLVINLEERIGRQVVSSGDDPVQFEIPSTTSPLRKTA